MLRIKKEPALILLKVFGISRGEGYLCRVFSDFARKHPTQLLPVSAIPIEPVFKGLALNVIMA